MKIKDLLEYVSTQSLSGEEPPKRLKIGGEKPINFLDKDVFLKFKGKNNEKIRKKLKRNKRRIKREE